MVAMQVATLSSMMERGVNMNTKDNDGLLPLDLAKENSHEEAYQLLFKVARSNLLVRTCEARTHVMIASLSMPRLQDQTW